ncbi:MAG: hypothetical protein ACT4PN_17175 [Nitrospiraceae bacterium]
MPCPLLPYRFHRLLPVWAKLQSTGAFIERREQATHHMINVRFWKDTDTGLHQEILMEEKHLGADERFIRRRIILAGEITQCLRRRPAQRRTEQRHNPPAQIKIFDIREQCHENTIREPPRCRSH